MNEIKSKLPMDKISTTIKIYENGKLLGLPENDVVGLKFDIHHSEFDHGPGPIAWGLKKEVFDKMSARELHELCIEHICDHYDKLFGIKIG
jgi:hypothetical protein